MNKYLIYLAIGFFAFTYFFKKEKDEKPTKKKTENDQEFPPSKPDLSKPKKEEGKIVAPKLLSTPRRVLNPILSVSNNPRLKPPSGLLNYE